MKSLYSFFILLIFAHPCWGQKVNLDLGFYSIKAVAPSGSTTGSIDLSSPGAYSLSANFAIRPQIELSPGYTVFYSKIFRGDMGFGPDFYLHYFPVTSGSGLKVSQGDISYFETEHIRPFVSFSFHQRQFQSVQSSYSGFGICLGSELQWTKISSLRTMFRTMSLAGPSGGTMNYMDLLVGYQMHF